MKVLMYHSFRGLPLHNNPTQPMIEFSDEMMSYESEHGKFSESYVWQVLKGLSYLDSDFLAHVSVWADSNNKKWGISYRFWIHITTCSGDWMRDTKGMPLIITSAGLLVTEIWKMDNRSRNPYDLDKWSRESGYSRELRKVPNSEKDSEFWRNFFMEKIKNATSEIIEIARL